MSRRSTPSPAAEPQGGASTTPPFRKRAAVATPLVLAATLSACGGAAMQRAPPQSAPAAAPEPFGKPDALEGAPGIEGALAEIDRAESELALALGGFAQPPPAGAPEAERAAPPPPMGGTPPPAATSPAPAERRDTDDAATQLGAPAGPPEPCRSACRALASMRRATDHLCGLTGEGDTRCSGARERVSRASERVRSGCPSCPAS